MDPLKALILVLHPFFFFILFFLKKSNLVVWMNNGLNLVDQVQYFIEDYEFIIKYNKMSRLKLLLGPPKSLSRSCVVAVALPLDMTLTPIQSLPISYQLTFSFQLIFYFLLISSFRYSQPFARILQWFSLINQLKGMRQISFR